MASPIVIYALPGSQFVFKVLAALKARDVEHFVQLVPLDPKKRELPSGGIKVPEMTVGTGESALVLTDSEKILHWFDDNQNTNFFPNEQASELSERASDKTLAAMVWYYNWVDDTGYSKSMKATIGMSMMPAFIPSFISSFALDFALKDTRAKFRNAVKSTLDLSEEDINDEPKMRGRLLSELEYFQDLLVKDETQEYLLPGEQPTAADFSVYAQLERLVGAGTASDIPIEPSLQELKENKTYQRLWQWHDNMREKFPVQFKGKRPPKELLLTSKL